MGAQEAKGYAAAVCDSIAAVVTRLENGTQQTTTAAGSSKFDNVSTSYIP